MNERKIKDTIIVAPNGTEYNISSFGCTGRTVYCSVKGCSGKTVIGIYERPERAFQIVNMIIKGMGSKVEIPIS